ncbi:hypothetical protein [Actinospica robiniae]|uniref:hypothetical protein n=1 Tax=Actinospica robiniae TaxID=304901 RepID=UPI000425213D|nr:hypothetical protein [Actinospica robiniae]
MNSWINLNALWKIVVWGLVLGGGLPALFAVGLRLWLEHGSAPAGGATTAAPSRGAQAIALICFAVILAAIGWGIYVIVSGT